MCWLTVWDGGVHGVTHKGHQALAPLTGQAVDVPHVQPMLCDGAAVCVCHHAAHLLRIVCEHLETVLQAAQRSHRGVLGAAALLL